MTQHVIGAFSRRTVLHERLTGFTNCFLSVAFRNCTLRFGRRWIFSKLFQYLAFKKKLVLPLTAENAHGLPSFTNGVIELVLVCPSLGRQKIRIHSGDPPPRSAYLLFQDPFRRHSYSKQRLLRRAEEEGAHEILVCRFSPAVELWHR